MKTLTALAAADLLILTVTTGATNAQMAGLSAATPLTARARQELVHKTGNRHHRGKIAAGIARGILGAAAIASRSHRY